MQLPHLLLVPCRLLASLVLVSAARAVAPVVSAVTISQRAGTKLVDIEYTVTDPDGDAMTITVRGRDVQHGADIAMISLTGDGANGATVTAGTHHLTWDAGADWNGNVTDDFRVTLRATESAVSPPGGEFVLIPAGTNSGTDPDFGAYSLTVTAFYMGKYEVTKAKWNEVRDWAVNHGYTDLPVGPGKDDNHPVHTVSWYDVVKWCNARSEMEWGPATCCYYTTSAKTTLYRTGNTNIEDNCVNWAATGYRLPTETEWEYAARGGLSGKRFPWGDTISHSQANYYSSTIYAYDVSPTRGYHPDYDTGGLPYTSPVGSFEAGKNSYGLYDMAGNTWEWNWTTSGSSRVGRGGGWSSSAYFCRVAYRFDNSPGSGSGGLGFRLVGTAP